MKEKTQTCTPASFSLPEAVVGSQLTVCLKRNRCKWRSTIRKRLEFPFSETSALDEGWSSAHCYGIHTHRDERMHVTSHRKSDQSLHLTRKEKVNHCLLSATVKQIYGSQVLTKDTTAIVGSESATTGGLRPLLWILQGTGKGIGIGASSADSIYPVNDHDYTLIMYDTNFRETSYIS